MILSSFYHSLCPRQGDLPYVHNPPTGTCIRVWRPSQWFCFSLAIFSGTCYLGELVFLLGRPFVSADRCAVDGFSQFKEFVQAYGCLSPPNLDLGRAPSLWFSSRDLCRKCPRFQHAVVVFTLNRLGLAGKASSAFPLALLFSPLLPPLFVPPPSPDSEGSLYISACRKVTTTRA